MKNHSTVEQIRNNGVTAGLIGFILGVGAGCLFLSDQIGYGAMALTGSIFSLFIMVLDAIKIHGRYVQLLILKLNGKTWEEVCPCDSCLAQQKNQEVNP